MQQDRAGSDVRLWQSRTDQRDDAAQQGEDGNYPDHNIDQKLHR
jgi:hypothetical protein